MSFSWRSSGEVLTLRRYPLELVGAVVTLSLLFYLLFLGARFLAGPGAEFGGRLEAVLAGYLLWTFTLSSYNSLSFGLMEEAQTGTLEQVFLTPYGPIPLFLVRNVAGLLAQGLLVLLVALTLMALTGARLAFTPGGSCPFWSWSWGGTAWASPWLPGPPLQAGGAGFGALPVPAPLPPAAPGSGVFLFLPLAPGAALARRMLAEGAPLEAGAWGWPS